MAQTLFLLQTGGHAPLIPPIECKLGVSSHIPKVQYARNHSNKGHRKFAVLLNPSYTIWLFVLFFGGQWLFGSLFNFIWASKSICLQEATKSRISSFVWTGLGSPWRRNTTWWMKTSSSWRWCWNVGAILGRHPSLVSKYCLWFPVCNNIAIQGERKYP